MKITYKKLDQFKAVALASRKVLYERFVHAHDVINNQNTEAIKVISEYNFWGGYHFAMLKITQLKQLKPSKKGLDPLDENNPLEIDKKYIEK